MGMIDFYSGRHLPANGKEKSVVEKIGEEGFFVRTDNSYHFYTTDRLFTENEFRERMEQIALSPEIGSHWPKLQLNQGYSLLRITPCTAKPLAPYIVPW